MTLGFKQKFPWGEPTYFREKILASVGYGISTNVDTGTKDIIKSNHVIVTNAIFGQIKHPKLHSIRAGSRWKAGQKIHMAYGVRTKNYEQFNKDIPELEFVKSVQSIRLTWVYKNAYIETKLPLRKITGPYGEFEYYPVIWIDGRNINESEATIERLAINDGFDTVNDFFRWFNKDFTGQLIHWTNFRY